MPTIKFYSLWGRSTIEIDIAHLQQEVLSNGRTALKAYDPVTYMEMLKVATVEELDLVSESQPDIEYLELMNKKYDTELQRRE